MDCVYCENEAEIVNECSPFEIECNNCYKTFLRVELEDKR